MTNPDPNPGDKAALRQKRMLVVEILFWLLVLSPFIFSLIKRVL